VVHRNAFELPGASRPRYTNESNAFGFYKRTVVLMLEIEEVAPEEGGNSRQAVKGRNNDMDS
jgi:hypothetical protein